jgi:O6-methylguanine-DNA--protein-cysteine methyltransferase
MREHSEHTRYAQDVLSLLVQKVGSAAVVKEFHNQLESYWCDKWPFNVPITDSHPYEWWEVLQSHPHGQVLTVRGC